MATKTTVVLLLRTDQTTTDRISTDKCHSSYSRIGIVLMQQKLEEFRPVRADVHGAHAEDRRDEGV